MKEKSEDNIIKEMRLIKNPLHTKKLDYKHTDDESEPFHSFFARS